MKATGALLLLAVCAHAEEIRVEIPKDPFLAAELAPVEGGPARALFASRLKELSVKIDALNAAARAHRAKALALQGRIDALKPELAAFDEEKARFAKTCTTPANKQVEAMCHGWAAKLRARREVLQGRRKVLADAAGVLGAALTDRLVRRRGALEKRIGSLHEQIEALKTRRDPGAPFGRAAAVLGDVFKMTEYGPERVSGDTVIGSRDEIWTGPGGGLRIISADSEILVGPNTHVTLEEPPAQPRGLWARLVLGILRVKGGAPWHRFAVRGPTCSIGRRGTDFIAEVTEEGTFTVTVLEGAVVCTPDGGGAPVLVAAPQRLEVKADGAFGRATRVDPAAAELVWRAAVGGEAPARDEQAGVPVALIVAAAALVLLIVLAFALRRRRV